MAKQPYPSQIAPKPTKRGEPKPYKNPYEDTRGNMQKPKKIGKRNPTAMIEKAMIMPKPARRLDTGIMGSSEEQAKQRKEKALLDMRKRGMLRKKQGQ